MVKYTREEQKKLIQRFEIQRAERRAALVNEMGKIGDIFESKIRRRLNTVPKKFAQLKIKDILAVEREQKVEIYELIQAIDTLHKNQARDKNVELMESEIAELKKKKVENVKKYQKRKESMAFSGKVSKPRIIRK